MTTYSHGTIAVVDFPFTSGTQSKPRPSLIVFDSGDADVIIARITSQIRQSNHDVALADWSSAGLRAPSIVRLHKLLTVEKALVRFVLGSVSKSDRQAVSAVLKSMFGNW